MTDPVIDLADLSVRRKPVSHHYVDLSGEDAARIPPGRWNLRIQDGEKTIHFETKTRRRLADGSTRFYGEQVR